MAPAHKVALITGAAGGIGSATVELFRQHGWAVVAVDREAVEQPAALVLRADVSQPDEADRIVTTVGEQYGRLDALVNNAAELLCKPLVETTVDEWERLMASNLRAVYLLVRRAYPLLAATSGCIVNVASIHALATSPGVAAYAASKGALVALTRSMAVEFAAEGIRVNAVLPGAIDTPMLAAGLRRGPVAAAVGGAPSAVDVLASRTPLGRVGRPEEVAQAIYFLADAERSAFITGQTLIVDGGAYAHLSTE